MPICPYLDILIHNYETLMMVVVLYLKLYLMLYLKLYLKLYLMLN